MNKKYIKKERGITLIALVITIVIIIILSAIGVNYAINNGGLMSKTEKAKEEAAIAKITEDLNLYEGSISIENAGDVDLKSYIEYAKTKEHKIEEEDNDYNTEINQYIIVDDEYVYLIEEKRNKDIEITYEGKIKEIESLKLSSYEGEYTYPQGGEFKVTRNATKGRIVVENSNTNIATAELQSDGKTIKVYPGIVEGQAEITVISEATSTYGEKTVKYIATVHQGILNVTATEYSGIYDSEAHGIIVTCEQEGATIEYSTDGENYSTTRPTFTNAETYTTYYKVSLAGYKTVSGSKTVTIGRATNELELSETEGTIVYPNTGTFTVNTNVSNGTITAEISDENVATVSVNDNNTITITPKAINSTQIATITVKSAQTGNYNEQTATYNLTVQQGTLNVTATEYSGTYDNSAHGITVTCEQSGATIEYSTDGENYSTTRPTFTNANAEAYTTYYKVSLAGYKTVSGSKTITIGKANNALELSETEGTIVYPNTGTVTIDTNASNGTITAEISDANVATVNVSNNNTITITPKTINSTQTATITVKSAATTNYEEQTATYNLTVQQGTLNVTATEYSGTYDNSAHGITVTCEQSGATIEYSTDGENYSTTRPTFTNANAEAYTTYYKVSLAGYKTVSGSKTITIGKANNALQLSTYNGGTISTPNTGTFTITKNTSGGTLSVSSSNTNIATVTLSGTTVTVTPGTTSGNVTITVRSAATTNYEEQTASYTANIVTCVHNYQWVTTTEATCTSTGTRTYKCSKCGATNGTEAISALGHNYQWVTTTSASCTSSGVETYKCSRCGATNGTRTISATGHTYNYKARRSSLVKRAATCTSGTQYYYECNYCSSYTTSNWWTDTDSLGHNYVNGVCSRCGATRSCTACNGTGKVSSTSNCTTCSGTGTITTVSNCSVCNGAGKVTCTASVSIGATEASNLSHYCSKCGKNTTHRRQKCTCPTCGATGGKIWTCKTCGTVYQLTITHNQVSCTSCVGTGKKAKTSTCSSCSGTGKKTTSSNCSTCGGTGYH